MLDTYVADIVIVHDVVLISKITALLTLLGCLYVLVWCEVIHYQGDLCAVKNAVKAVLLELIDSHRAGYIVAEDHIQLSPDELSLNNTVKTRVLCKDLLCHRHTHV